MLSLKLGFVPWAESVRISAKHGSGLRELFRAVHRAHESANKTFTTSEVNKALEVAYETNPPPTIRGHVSKLRYVAPGRFQPADLHRARHAPEGAAGVAALPGELLPQALQADRHAGELHLPRGYQPVRGQKNVLTERQVKAKRR